MKILLAGGGTGGHINPAIAIANTIRDHDKNAEIAFIATKKGLENKLVSNAGYPIYHIEMRGLRRSLSLSNLKTAYYYFTAPRKARRLLLEFEPDIAIGTGGYLCWPLLHAAAKLGIPTAVHESNAIPGKAVKMLEKEVDRIYTNFPTTADYLKEKDKIRCAGNPLISPPSVQGGGDLKAQLRIPAGTRRVILSFGGSLGAKRINEEILELMRALSAKNPDVFHIHATGKIEHEATMAKAKEYELDKCPNIRLLEYIYDMPLWERVADVVICRAGAMTISEMALLGRACILIPSPNVVNNHQYENAKQLADAGAAVLLEEKYLTSNVLYDSVCSILYNKETSRRLSEAIKTFAHPSSQEEIYEDLRMLVSRDVLTLIQKKET